MAQRPRQSELPTVRTQYYEDDGFTVYSPPSRAPTWAAPEPGRLDRSYTAASLDSLDGQAYTQSTTGNEGPGRPLVSETQIYSTGIGPTLAAPARRHTVEMASDLGQQITELLYSNNLHDLEGHERDHVPLFELRNLMTRDRMVASFPYATEKLIQFMLDNPKVSAVLTLVFSQEQRLTAIKSFADAGLYDKHLPIKDIARNGQCDSFRPKDCNSKPCELGADCIAFHAAPWSSITCGTFYDRQWSFLVASFDHTNFTRVFEPRELLPFTHINSSRASGAGHFSLVYQGEMLTSHQNTLSTPDHVVPVAIKELRQFNEPNYDVVRDFRNESTALSVFTQLGLQQREQRLGCDHIVRGIGAFQQRDHYYLVMEFAQLGSLQDFWEKHPKIRDELTSQRMQQLLVQFRGLAAALNEMHNFRTEEEVHDRIIQPVGGLQETNWRHSDMKPGNILVFRKEDCWPGQLKIGDLGRARRHDRSTQQRPIGTGEKFGTWRYEAPEAWTALSSARSRVYDLWSFGCIVFDTVLWLLYDASVVKELDNQRVAPGQGSPYWTFANIALKTARVQPNISLLMQDLLDKHPACRGSTAIRDLIQLVQTKLLIVQPREDPLDPTLPWRADSEMLLKELDRMVKEGQNNADYLVIRHDERPSPPALVVQEQPKQNLLVPDNYMQVSDIVSSHVKQPVGIQDSYLHPFEDSWIITNNNDFAKVALENLTQGNGEGAYDAAKASCCPRCRAVTLIGGIGISDDLVQLRQRAAECRFCAMRLALADLCNESGKEAVAFKQIGSRLFIKDTSDTAPFISLCRTKDEPLLDHGPTFIQIGLPHLPNGGSEEQMNVLATWLDDCDETHTNCRPDMTLATLQKLPTRLIDVGTLDSPILKLIETKTLRKGQRSSRRYLALSHPWGNRKQDVHVCTTPANAKQYAQSIDDTLPKTLQDAVTVTRMLKIPYLWVDSLCVLQGPEGDFAQQAELMETVFSLAYCVIAASSAIGSSSGFLHRSCRREISRKEQSGVFALSLRLTKDSKETIDVHMDLDKNGLNLCRFDDFDRDVRKGRLNQRGWVFQERALARRTIHFTDNQVYWECGHGIRCESMTQLHNRSEAFFGDSNFPSYGLSSSKGGDIDFYENLFQQYSAKTFTMPEDRLPAIAGLERRLRAGLQKKHVLGRGNFGLFDDYWGRGLLWQRLLSPGNKMTRLKSTTSVPQPAPSWSWLGHSGAVQFLKHEPRTVQWLSDVVKLPWAGRNSASGSSTSYRGNTGLSGYAYRYSSCKNDRDTMKFDVVYDQPDGADACEREQPDNAPALRCFVVGEAKHADGQYGQRRYVLIIRQQSGPTSERVYERIGAGSMTRDLIDEGSALRVVVE